MSALALQSFGFEGTEVRTLWRGDAPWFVAQDICAALEIGNNRDAVARLAEDERGVVTTDTLGGVQEVSIISESGMYALIFKSRKPAAVRFRKWVTSEVLPTLRRTGRYLMMPANDEDDLALENADDIERLKAKVSLVREARYVFGRKTAQVVWDKLGLPLVTRERFAGLEFSPDDLDPSVRQWLVDRCELTPSAREESSVLYDDYVEWCGEHEVEILPQSTFGRTLTRAGLRALKSGRIQRLGVRLRD